MHAGAKCTIYHRSWLMSTKFTTSRCANPIFYSKLAWTLDMTGLMYFNTNPDRFNQNLLPAVVQVCVYRRLNLYIGAYGSLIMSLLSSLSSSSVRGSLIFYNLELIDNHDRLPRVLFWVYWSQLSFCARGSSISRLLTITIAYRSSILSFPTITIDIKVFH